MDNSANASLRPALLGADTEAEPAAAALPEIANEVLLAASGAVRVAVGRATEDMYATLLDSVQDYLIDNARFNIGERIASAERQARHDREAWGKAEGRVRVLTDLLRDLWFATASGTEHQRVRALSNAGDFLARIGAIGHSAADTADRPTQIPGGAQS